MINIKSLEQYTVVDAIFLCPNDITPHMILVRGVYDDPAPKGIEIDQSIKQALIEDPKTHKPRDPLAFYGRHVELGLLPSKEICEVIVFKSEGQGVEEFTIEASNKV
ncbi:MAG: hypothetical protein Q7K55_06260 [Candidatus Levybacteria bacterium]|nr:hypothetical protein [Candidatus Levybacteria bacterium]